MDNAVVETMLSKTRSSTTTRKLPNRWMKFFSTPKGVVLISLVILALFGVSTAPHVDARALGNVGVAVITGLLVDFLVGVWYKRKRYVSDGGIITGLIVAMVLSSSSSWTVVAGTTAIALASKHILRVKRMPIFNPAAFGLLVSSYVFMSMQSWWGGMSLVSNGYLILVAIIGVWVTRRVKKFPQVIAFLITYVGLCLILMLFSKTNMDASFALQNPMVNSALFLAFFMLTDPPTSPTSFINQIWFGCLTALISIAVYMLFPAELTYLFIGLMVANVCKWIQRQWFSNQKKGSMGRRGPRPESSLSQSRLTNSK